MFQIDGYNYCKGGMITVTKVNISPDLSVARAYISIFGASDKNETIKNITDNLKDIRFKLGNKIKNQVRIIPNLEFFVDDTLDYIENIDKLLKK